MHNYLQVIECNIIMVHTKSVWYNRPLVQIRHIPEPHLLAESRFHRRGMQWIIHCVTFISATCYQAFPRPRQLSYYPALTSESTSIPAPFCFCFISIYVNILEKVHATEEYDKMIFSHSSPNKWNKIKRDEGKRTIVVMLITAWLSLL